MLSLGNWAGRTYTTNPPQWDELFVCHRDRVKRVVRRMGLKLDLPPDVGGYETVP